MGFITGGRQVLILLLMLSALPGCVALTTVAAVPGSLVGAVAGQFVGQEVSVAYNMRHTIASIQSVLQSTSLDIDILEIQKDGGYMIGFSNDKLDGTISLRKQTERLTTIYVKVRANTREESVESAIINLVEQELKRLPDSAQFKKERYHKLMEKPSMASGSVGWFRQGARLSAEQSGKYDWLKIKLPSGNIAYLKGSIVAR